MKKFPVFLLVVLVFSSADGSARPSRQAPETVSSIKTSANPWSRDIIYFFLVDRFANGEKKNDFHADPKNIMAFQGGDLQGVNQNLDYFDRLGVTTLLFTPIMENRKRDFFGHWGLHGYWIIDHQKIDEHWGDQKVFQEFTRRRLSSRKKLLLDLVLNHVDWDHPWYKEHPAWFHQLGPIADWNDPKQLLEGQVSGLPDLDQDNPEVYKLLLDYAKRWVRLSRADGLRLDAVKHIDHRFWKKFIAEVKESVKEKPDFLFLGEILHGDPYFYLPYIEDGFNGFYNYPLYYTVKEVFAENRPMHHLASRLQLLDRLFPQSVTWVNFLDNHDMPRFLSLNQAVDAEDLRQALAFHAVIAGVPMIYYGTESCMKGESGEKGRLMMDLANTPGAEYIRELDRMRLSSPALTQGIREDLLVADEYYVFRRLAENEEAIAAFSRAKGPVRIRLPLEPESLFADSAQAQDRLSKRSFPIQGRHLLLSLGPKDAAVFIAQGASPRYRRLLTAPPENKTFRVEVRTEPLEPGQEIYIAGANAFLGSWKTDEAAGPLKKEGDFYAAELQAPLGTAMEYKLIKKNARGEVRWEENPNRFYFIDARSEKILLEWNKL